MRHGSSCGCPDCEDFHPDRFTNVGQPLAPAPETDEGDGLRNPKPYPHRIISVPVETGKLGAREWLINGGGGFEDGADGIRACTMSAEAAIELMDEFASLKVEQETRERDSWRRVAACLGREVSELREAARKLPLESFGDDMSKHDAADFVDHAGEFFEAMVEIRRLLSKGRE